MRRRAADRVARIGPESDQPEVRGDRGGGAAARSGSDTVERVRIPRVAGEHRVHCFVRAERPLCHVRFREHDRAGVLDPFDLERVALRIEVRERQRSRGGLQPDRLEVVLHDRRHAMERSHGTGRLVAAIQFGRFGPRRRVDHRDRIQCRAALVIGVDPTEVEVHQRRAGEPSTFHRGVYLGDRGFLETCRLPLRGQQHDDGEQRDEDLHGGILSAARPPSRAGGSIADLRRLHYRWCSFDRRQP